MSILESFRLDNRLAIVTGGGRGLGRAMAMALAEAGANIAVIDIDGDTASDAADSIRRLGGDAESYSIDLTDYGAVESTIAAIRERFGGIDILLNNAGVVYGAQQGYGPGSIPTEDVTPENWDRVIKVDLSAVFYCSQLAGRVMMQQKRGNIINVASMSGFIANLGRHNNAYCAAKAGVVNFTRQLAGDWADRGIRVNAIGPGYMKTEMGAGPLEDPAIKDLIVRMTPMRRPGTPEDLKGLVVFLASDASEYITGQTIVIDGGYTVW